MRNDGDTDLDLLFQTELPIKHKPKKLKNGPTKRELHEQTKVEKKNKRLAAQAIARYMANRKKDITN